MCDKSDKELFEDVSKQNLFDISYKIQRSIGKAKKKKMCIAVSHKDQAKKRKNDIEFFSKLMESQNNLLKSQSEMCNSTSEETNRK
jgi:hypothetical protein